MLLNISFCSLAYTCVSMSRSPLLMSPSLLFLLCWACFVLFLRLKVSDHTIAVLWDTASKICSKQHTTSLYCSNIGFSLGTFSNYKVYHHTIVPPKLHPGRIPILFYQRDQITIWSLTCQLWSKLYLALYLHHFQLMRFCYIDMWTG